MIGCQKNGSFQYCHRHRYHKKLDLFEYVKYWGLEKEEKGKREEERERKEEKGVFFLKLFREYLLIFVLYYRLNFSSPKENKQIFYNRLDLGAEGQSLKKDGEAA